MSMSLLNDVQKFIEAHPGCTSGDIADAFAGYSRQRVLQSASKLRQSGRVAHRCEGDTHRHFPRLTERAQDPEPNQFVKPDLCAISMSALTTRG